jgi:hypothetical protein
MQQPIIPRRYLPLDMTPEADGNGKVGVPCTAMVNCGPKFEALAQGLDDVNLRLDGVSRYLQDINSSLLLVFAALGKK